MDIGDQWSFSESDSSKNPAGDSTSLAGSAALPSESKEIFPKPSPGSDPGFKKKSGQNDFWIEFQNPEISATNPSDRLPEPMPEKASGDTRVRHWQRCSQAMPA